jgi:hypothetical protein
MFIKRNVFAFCQISLMDKQARKRLNDARYREKQRAEKGEAYNQRRREINKENYIRQTASATPREERLRRRRRTDYARKRRTKVKQQLLAMTEDVPPDADQVASKDIDVVPLPKHTSSFEQPPNTLSQRRSLSFKSGVIVRASQSQSPTLSSPTISLLKSAAASRREKKKHKKNLQLITAENSLLKPKVSRLVKRLQRSTHSFSNQHQSILQSAVSSPEKLAGDASHSPSKTSLALRIHFSMLRTISMRHINFKGASSFLL